VAVIANLFPIKTSRPVLFVKPHPVNWNLFGKNGVITLYGMYSLFFQFGFESIGPVLKVELNTISLE